jgi:hypothetical protein
MEFFKKNYHFIDNAKEKKMLLQSIIMALTFFSSLGKAAIFKDETSTFFCAGPVAKRLVVNGKSETYCEGDSVEKMRYQEKVSHLTQNHPGACDLSSPLKRHINPNGTLGGFYDKKSFVSPSVFLSENSLVCGGVIEGRVNLNKVTLVHFASIKGRGTRGVRMENVSAQFSDIEGDGIVAQNVTSYGTLLMRDQSILKDIYNEGDLNLFHKGRMQETKVLSRKLTILLHGNSQIEKSLLYGSVLAEEGRIDDSVIDEEVILHAGSIVTSFIRSPLEMKNKNSVITKCIVEGWGSDSVIAAPLVIDCEKKENKKENEG